MTSIDFADNWFFLQSDPIPNTFSAPGFFFLMVEASSVGQPSALCNGNAGGDGMCAFFLLSELSFLFCVDDFFYPFRLL